MAEMSATLRKKVLPWRGGAFPRPAVDLKKVHARLREVRGLEALSRVFQSLAIELDGERLAALRQRVDGPIETIETFHPQVEAAMLCLMGGNDHAWDRAHEIGADMVHLWCAKTNVAQATLALLLNAEYEGSGKRSPGRTFQAFFPYIGPWRALRGYLAHAPEADYQAALKEVRARVWGRVRWMAAHAMPTESSLVEESVGEALATHPNPHAIGLLASVEDPELFAQLASHLAPYVGHDFIGIKFSDYLPSAVARLGDQSFEGLRRMAETVSKVGDKRFLAELLSELRHPGVRPWFQARLQDKAFGPAGHAYLDRLGAQGAVDGPPDGQVGGNPAARAGQAIPAETPPLSGSGGDPAILRQPPWENRVSKKGKPQVWKLQLASFPEKVELPLARQEIIKRYGEPRDATSSQKWIAYYTESLAKGQKGFFPEYLCDLHDRAWAIKQWNEAPADRWNPYTLRSSYGATAAERILYHFGVEAIPGLLTTLSVAPDVTYAALGHVDSARLAPVWAEAWMTKKKFRKAANAWFARFPKAAAVGLLPLALGPVGKARTQCEAVIRWMEGKGLGESLREAAQAYGASAGLDQILAYDPLQELPARMPALPSWFSAQRCHAPRTTAGAKLSEEAINNLALMLAISSLETPYAGLDRLECDAESLREFAWSVYEQWQRAGGPAKEDWGFRALAYLGGDHCARKLAPELRKWPGEGLSARASTGLDILRYVGTDVALTHLHGIALKVRFKALQDKARQHIQEIADERGLSVDELSDRLVPDLDLDPDGGMPLGQYRVTFDEYLRPRLLDERGRILPELPKGSPADLDKAWKALKKDAKAVAAVQLERLEQALTKQRRWSCEVFGHLLVDHPLMIHLVRRLVWGVYEGERLLRTFRVAEDRSFANQADDPVGLEGIIGLYHPLDDPLQVQGWSKLFADYEIIQPFAQLERSIHTLPAGPKGARLTTYRGTAIPGGHLLSLERRGWRRGEVESGCLLDMTRPPFTLELDEGLPVEDVAGSTVVLGEISSQTPWEELSEVAVSELLRDMESLSQKALNKV